jgi:hypothetical protein
MDEEVIALLIFIGLVCGLAFLWYSGTFWFNSVETGESCCSNWNSSCSPCKTLVLDNPVPFLNWWRWIIVTIVALEFIFLTLVIFNDKKRRESWWNYALKWKALALLMTIIIYVYLIPLCYLIITNIGTIIRFIGKGLWWLGVILGGIAIIAIIILAYYLANVGLAKLIASEEQIKQRKRKKRGKIKKK